MSISSNIIYWIAALLEGEGCFHVRSQISLEMSDLDVIIKARDILDPNVKIISIPSQNSNHKDKYRINICGNLAIQWMMTIYSIMGVRRKARIKEALMQWKFNRMGVRGSDVCGRGHQLIRLYKDYKISLDGRKRCMHCVKIVYNERRLAS